MKFLVLAASLLAACQATAPARGPANSQAQLAGQAPLPSADPLAAAKAACFAEPVHYAKNAAPSEILSDTEPGRQHCSKAEASTNCRVEVARAHFAANRFERAAPLFLELAQEKPPTRGMAIQLAFESLNALVARAEPPRPECYDIMRSETLRFLDQHCTPDPQTGDEKACALLLIIDVDAGTCPQCPLKTMSGRDPITSYLAAARLHLRLAHSSCLFGQGRQLRNEENKCDELLYDAYRWFTSGRDPVQAEAAKRQLLDPRNGLHKTQAAKGLR